MYLLGLFPCCSLYLWASFKSYSLFQPKKTREGGGICSLALSTLKSAARPTPTPWEERGMRRKQKGVSSPENHQHLSGFSGPGGIDHWANTVTWRLRPLRITIQTLLHVRTGWTPKGHVTSRSLPATNHYWTADSQPF